jgi:lysophospholipase L1-like esterase
VAATAGRRRGRAAVTTSALMAVISRVVPGVGRIHAQVLPFAQAWREANAAALALEGPLWVALGDSMTQGIGAAGISGGWAGQLAAQLPALRLVNLSVTGARVHDVLAGQLPRMRDLGVRPDLVTVLIGANDMLTRRRRVPAVGQFAALLDAVGDYDTIVATLPSPNKEARAINALIERAAATGRVRVADMRGGLSLRDLRGTLSSDYFHPNERGYAGISAAFAAVTPRERQA